MKLINQNAKAGESVPRLSRSLSAASLFRTLLLIVATYALLALPAQAQQLGGLEYRIGPEDVLHISVWKDEDLDRQVLVRPDGGISYRLKKFQVIPSSSLAKSKSPGNTRWVVTLTLFRH